MYIKFGLYTGEYLSDDCGEAVFLEKDGKFYSRFNNLDVTKPSRFGHLKSTGKLEGYSQLEN
jgi:hypothetical protein